jgi:hypothetical protein
LEASIASTGTDFAPMVLVTVAKAVSRVRLITRRSAGCLMELDPVDTVSASLRFVKPLMVLCSVF